MVYNVQPKLIGISGCTNGGKSTLCKLLLNEFPNSCHFSQDDFYHKRDSEHLEYIEELNSFNFDVISAINMKKFHSELARVIESGQYEYIFLDGILLYEDERLCQMLDMKYFLTINRDECFRRRQSRNYIIADTAHYFDKCVWGEFQKYKLKCESTLTTIKYMNGTDSPQLLLSNVINDLKSICSSTYDLTPQPEPCESSKTSSTGSLFSNSSSSSKDTDSDSNITCDNHFHQAPIAT